MPIEPPDKIAACSDGCRDTFLNVLPYLKNKTMTVRNFHRFDKIKEMAENEPQIYDSNTYVREYTYLGLIGEKNEAGMYTLEQRNKFSVGETIEIMKPNGENVNVVVKRIVNEDGADQESAPHSKQVLYIDLDGKADVYDILRRAE